MFALRRSFDLAPIEQQGEAEKLIFDQDNDHSTTEKQTSFARSFPMRT